MATQTWLITGVNSGFGREMTEQLLARGDRVAGTVRKMDAMSDLKAKYPSVFVMLFQLGVLPDLKGNLKSA
jgi:NADP-dependent 3-hydroxy acid dehydrogenase YdfG